jgi:NAD(P)H dehydrogenase (quinone)
MEVRAGDFDRPDSLQAAIPGPERLLLISTEALGRRLPQHQAAIDAAAAAGVSHVVYTSIVTPTPDNVAAPVAEHAGTEDALRASGLDWTMLRMSLYQETFVPPTVEAASGGRLVHNAAGGKVAWVSRGDCAAAAAAVLAGGGHRGIAYDITGPELLSRAQVGDLLADVTDRPVETVAMDDEEYVAELVAHGLPPIVGAWVGDLEGVAQAVATFGVAIREGAFAVVSTAVEELTGRPPRRLREVLLQHREALLAA